MNQPTPDSETAPHRSGNGLVRIAVWTVVAVVAGFVAGFFFFSNHVSDLETPGNPDEAESIIVLTGGHYRLDAAVDLLRNGKGQRLLISGVNPVTDADDLRRATGAAQALFDCCIDIDHAALNTIGNASESARWAADNGFSSAILVTNNYHMPRSLLEMRRADAALRIVPYPVVNTPLSGGEWLRNREALRVLFTEYTKYLAALMRGAFGR
ncbi:MAG: YdcF family protein [Rhizobiaceae bacterium]|nr:YdcF family protein [Rhizobiaceae bacterium]